MSTMDLENSIGKRYSLNGVVYEVIGVIPEPSLILQRVDRFDWPIYHHTRHVVIPRSPWAQNIWQDAE